MNLLVKLEQLNLDAATITEVAAKLQALMDQATTDVKIGSLAYEPFYYKRIRFSRNNENPATLPRSLTQLSPNKSPNPPKMEP